MTYQEIIKAYIEEGYCGKDNTCNGKCIKCGKCCGTILPLDEEDAKRIQDYVFKNKIFINKYMLVMRSKLQCPYYNGDKEKGCSIYEARPKICRYYKCDLVAMNLKELKSMVKTVPVDMWSFAEAIEKEMKKYYATNKETRKAIDKSI